MITLTEIRPAGRWDHATAADTLTLTYDERYRRRRRLTTDGGLDCLLSLARAVPIGHGDGLVGDNGRVYRVQAAPEPLLEIRGESPVALARLAWHLGNRHTPADVGDGHILIRHDHVLEQMLVGLGAQVAHVERPFQPERGAYHDHGHSHDHGHDHSHDHGHSHGHGHG